MNDETCIRVPLKIAELVKIPQNILDEHYLYVTLGTEYFDSETIVYLDHLIEVDDETEEEIYPTFSLKHDLDQFFSGRVVYDIISNTTHQLPHPTVDDFINNFNYYNEHDSFFIF